jgi:microcystin-dependent protein
MHLIFPGNLPDRFDAHQSFQSDFGFKGTRVSFPFSFTHSPAVLSPPAEPEKSNLSYCPNSGVHFSFPRQAITAAPYAAFANNGMPSGAITAFAGTSVPPGWLPCDGSAVSSNRYPALFSAISTNWGAGYEWNGSTWVKGTNDFNLPDLRGLFFRGVNGTRTNFVQTSTTFVDPDVLSRTDGLAGGNRGNAVGSMETDQFTSHRHDSGGNTGSNTDTTRFPTDINAGRGMYFSSGYAAGADTSATGGAETRPKNAYVNYIIKY